MKKLDPAPASDVPSDTICVGGPVPWFSVSLSIIADELDPDAVTRLLGVAPDETRGRGVPDTSGLARRFGAWTIRLRREQTSEADVSEAIRVLLDRIPASTEAWNHARARAEARIFVGLRLDTFNRGLRLPADLMRRLGDWGLHLDLDIYAVEATENQR